jgi:hypothetical protein
LKGHGRAKVAHRGQILDRVLSASIGSVAKRVVMVRPKTGYDVLEYEIREEQAATMGRLGRELQDALDALDAFKREVRSEETPAHNRDVQRERLVAAAGYALWNFVVQRECSGFRGTEHILKDYVVPPEVRARMGVTRPR